MTLRLSGPALALALLAGAAAATPALARDATVEERGRIEAALRAQGFQSWGSIGMDDGLWEVDDARTSDGHGRDLRLAPDDLSLIDTEVEDRRATPEEKAAIEQALHGQGFTKLESVSLEDGVWEVDDALGPDNKRYDLKLERQSFRILHRDQDD